jgi:hypothetical protein
MVYSEFTADLEDATHFMRSLGSNPSLFPVSSQHYFDSQYSFVYKKQEGAYKPYTMEKILSDAGTKVFFSFLLELLRNVEIDGNVSEILFRKSLLLQEVGK